MEIKKKIIEYEIKKQKKPIAQIFCDKLLGFNFCLRKVPLLKNGFIDYRKKIVHTNGVNFFFFWKNGDLMDLKRIFSNDIYALFQRYGIEAAREGLFQEINLIFQVQSMTINFHHLDIISDYITRLGNLRPFSRKGIYEESPLQKITYETALEFLVDFSLNKQTDFLQTSSGSLGLGKICGIGTGSFKIIAKR
jgi:DNA-directed RNA polymerase I subunit RPA1